MNLSGQRVTRADVAKAAGVSETIVSYVVNNNRYVAAEKRRRVEEAIAELHYRPNNAARALKGKRSNQLLFIADQIANEYFCHIVSEMDKYAYEAGFLISLCANRNTREFVTHVISSQYDGIIISSTNFPMEYADGFRAAGIPVLIFKHRNHENLSDSYVTLSSGLYSGIRIGVRHLVERGRRNIIYIDRISESGNISGPTDLRLSGFYDEMEAQGLKVEASDIIQGCRSEKELMEVVSKRLIDGKKVDGIVGRNDMCACIAMNSVKNLGYRIPEDIGVVGFDNSSISRFCSPRLTTLEMQRENICKTAILMITQMINGEKPENAKFNTTLIVREST